MMSVIIIINFLILDNDDDEYYNFVVSNQAINQECFYSFLFFILYFFFVFFFSPFFLFIIILLLFLSIFFRYFIFIYHSQGLKHTPLAVLSRPVVGTRFNTLICTLPGRCVVLCAMLSYLHWTYTYFFWLSIYDNHRIVYHYSFPQNFFI